MRYAKNKTKKHVRSRARGSPRRSPIVTRSVTRKRAQAQAQAQAQAHHRAQGPSFRVRSMVYITGPRINVTGTGRVAQVVRASRNKQKYVVRLNYSGQVLVVKKEHLRKATEAEKRADPKLHYRESPIGRIFLDDLEA